MAVTESKSEFTDILPLVPNCLCIHLRAASRVTTRFYDEALSPSGIRISQLSILASVVFHEPIQLSNLAKMLFLDRTTMTADLKPLEAKGFIRITIGLDRRTRVIEMTKEGREALRIALPLWRAAQHFFQNQLGEVQTNQILQNMKEVVGISPAK